MAQETGALTKESKNGTWYFLALHSASWGNVSRLKWSNPGKEVTPSPAPRYSCYWKWSLRVTLDHGRQLILWWGVRSCILSKRKEHCPCYDTRLHLIKFLRIWITLSLPLLPVAVSAWISSLDQIVPLKKIIRTQSGREQRKILKKQQIVIMNIYERDSLTLWLKTILDGLTCRKDQSINELFNQEVC